MIRRPRLFPLAVGLAVKGYHFFEITAEIPRAEAFSRRLEKTEIAVRARMRRILRLRSISASGEARIRRVVALQRRRYERFGESMQLYLRHSFTRFIDRCDTWMGLLDRMRRLAEQPQAASV
jgi:hypothetical protein